jgi:hypothetical protein
MRHSGKALLILIVLAIASAKGDIFRVFSDVLSLGTNRRPRKIADETHCAQQLLQCNEIGTDRQSCELWKEKEMYSTDYWRQNPRCHCKLRYAGDLCTQCATAYAATAFPECATAEEVAQRQQAEQKGREEQAAQRLAAEQAALEMQELTDAAVQLATELEWTGYSTDVLRGYTAPQLRELIAEMNAHVTALDAHGGSTSLKAAKAQREAQTEM